MFKKLARAVVNDYSGKRDFLEATCAAAALVTAADGKIEDSEIEAAVTSMSDHKTLSVAYSGAEIEDEMTKALRKAKTISGKAGLKREIEEVASKDRALREDVFLIAADVADSTDGIGEAERKMLDTVATLLRVDSKALLGG